MADHLPLPAPLSLDGGKRPAPYPGDRTPVDRRIQATTLRGILEGLESRNPGVFPEPAGADDELDAADLGRIVLKISGKAPFGSAGLGGWDNKLIQLGFNNNNTFFALSDSDSRAFFRSLVADYDDDPEHFDPQSKAWLTALNNIDGVELYGRADRAAPDLPTLEDGSTTVVDVSIWPTSLAGRGEVKEALARLAEIRALVADDPSGVSRVFFATAENPDRIALRARVDQTTLNALLEHPLVERVTGPLSVHVTAADLASARRPSEPVIAEGAPIGIIDDLVVDANPWMNGVVRKRRDFPSSEALGSPTTHGSYVAAIAAWGRVADLLDGTVTRRPHPIFAARVAHANADGRSELADQPTQQVESAMRWLHSEGVRVVVFAFAQSYAHDGALPAELSAAVDSLAAKLNMVVVVSAGNLADLPDGLHWADDYPKYLAGSHARIAAPGTAALAVTVGSVAHSEEVDRGQFPFARTITKIGQGAPFSRTGPTANGQQKPEFAGRGGSWSWDHATEDVVRNDANVAAVTLRPVAGGRLFSVVSGTSFAAPHVAHEIATIATRYPNAGANLLRALTALSATPPKQMPSVQHATYGLPRAERVLESEGNQAILVREDTIGGGSYQIIQLPVPDQFTSGAWEREFRVAVAYDPPVRRSRREYIGGHIDVHFVRNRTLEEIRDIYRSQPTLAQRASGAAYWALPENHDRPPLRPGVQSVNRDTVFCRNYLTKSAAWNVDDKNYFLVIEHTCSPWSDKQKREAPTQDYAVAVELIAHGQPTLDLHALTQARLDVQTRVRGRV